MADKPCILRLQKEYRALCKEPVPHVVARPSQNDILEWHYVLEGSEGTPFAGGYYYGKIKFPADYPFKPPGITSSRELESHVVCFKMDNSPTTGSVNTSTAEKKRLAKASLAFNCKNATFKKLFPEYVEKYNEQKVCEHQVVPEQEENCRGKKVKSQDAEDGKKADILNEANKKRKQSFPTWMMLLLLSVLGIVMALPLLQL
ncbi:hypothetical protein ACFE04_003813 [Oxalis oulophora]